MKILFVIGSLGSGGAEKIFMDIIKNIDCTKHSIKILLVDHYGVYLNEVPENIEVDYIFEHAETPVLKRKWYGIVSIIGRFFLRKVSPAYFYKKHIHEKFDVEIAFLEGEATSLVAQSPNKESVKYAWLHTDMIKNPWSEKCYANPEKEKEAYKAYDRVLAVSSSVKEAFEEKFGYKAEVFYNALDEKEVFRKADEPLNESMEQSVVRFVSVGRLKKVKGYSRLLNVFAKITDKYSNVELGIVGDGSERAELEKQIKDAKLEKCVKLYGYKSNPYPYMKNSDIFVCSSFAEGFSTVVTESLILGLPVITTDCAGMRELLGESEYGLIVENSEEGLYNGIEKLILDSDLRENYRLKAIEKGKQFCVRDRILELEKLIEKDCGKKIEK